MGEIKFFGVTYNTNRDEFSVKINTPLKTYITKRNVVSCTNSVYDPIGMTAPMLIKLKTLMREIFEKGIDWNDYVNADMTNKWNDVCYEINDVTVKIPRALTNTSPNVHTSESEVRGDLNGQEATLPTNCTQTEIRSSSDIQGEGCDIFAHLKFSYFCSTKTLRLPS